MSDILIQVTFLKNGTKSLPKLTSENLKTNSLSTGVLLKIISDIQDNQEKKSFKWDICEIKFTEKKSLELHVASILEELLKCALCDNAFSQKIHLETHVDEVHESN